jgi:hypothetical protein
MLPPSPLRRVLALCLSLLLTRCASDMTGCRLDMVARLPLVVHDDLLLVAAGINRGRVRFVVDTGAERTTIAASAA